MQRSSKRNKIINTQYYKYTQARYRTCGELFEAHGAETPVEFHRKVHDRTDCGASVAFIDGEGTEVSGDALSAKQNTIAYADRHWLGVRFHAIVEGSDAEFSSDALMFPFTDEAMVKVWDRLEVQVDACIAEMSEENEHTPGAWFLREGDPTIILAPDDAYAPWLVAKVDKDCGGSLHASRSNARRIVECVNACEGIKNPGETIPAVAEALRGVLLIVEALHPNGVFPEGGSIMTIIERAKDTLAKLENKNAINHSTN